MTQNERIRAARALVNSELVPELFADMHASIVGVWAQETDQTKRGELWRRQSVLNALWEKLAVTASLQLDGENFDG